LPEPALAAAESAFARADRVSFLTASTQRYYSGLSDGSNYRLNPGWIDLAAIDRFRRDRPRDELRAHLGVPTGRKLVINVGTICERKGQHIFARAVEWLWQSAPSLAAQADFLMIGGRDTAYDRELADFVTGLHRSNLRIVRETQDVYSYYGAADVFACSSYEESFPRVVLEAMAFGLPIASTHVHGIPEMARPEREALLVPPGDPVALAGALQRLLSPGDHPRTLAAQARERVAEFDSRVLLPRHLALAQELMPALAQRDGIRVISP
jgi:glycosyltransferase involved in cell wall biosynthesis